jgi:hypothetical protein
VTKTFQSPTLRQPKPFFSHKQLLFSLIGDDFLIAFGGHANNLIKKIQKRITSRFLHICMGIEIGFCLPIMGGSKSFLNHQQHIGSIVTNHIFSHLRMLRVKFDDSFPKTYDMSFSKFN